MKRPLISLVVVLYNMRREAQRTLHSLSAAYQRGISPAEYEVQVIENGSDEPVGEETVRACGANFHYTYLNDASPSPARALNAGIQKSRGRMVGLMIDGAHILTPRVLAYSKQLATAVTCPLIAVRRFYLGPGQQPETTQEGYDRAAEDALLAQIDWPRNPYRLFEISTFMGKKRPGWFGRFWETNCLILPRAVLDAQQGCDERFALPGGGFLNLDLFARATEYPGSQVYMLLGEGSFHQLHGGTTTNVAPDEVECRVARYRQDYAAIRGQPYEMPRPDLQFFGSLDPHSFLV